MRTELVLEGGHEAPPVDETGQLVRDRLALDDVVEASVLDGDRRLSREPDGKALRLGVEAAGRRVEQHRRRALRRAGRAPA